ncbi:hypothetical protein ACFB49_25370 [Sphingomonas sp. DBB INV C78]|uniref:hypothetical protein n=1 Tax=Sphingomonas sp. DBB INV C78 TaxID=3349434 RepID=UPI0036D40F6E
MAIEVEIEELRAELSNPFDASERALIRAELDVALARKIEADAAWERMLSAAN